MIWMVQVIVVIGIHHPLPALWCSPNMYSASCGSAQRWKALKESMSCCHHLNPIGCSSCSWWVDQGAVLSPILAIVHGPVLLHGVVFVPWCVTFPVSSQSLLIWSLPRFGWGGKGLLKARILAKGAGSDEDSVTRMTVMLMVILFRMVLEVVVIMRLCLFSFSLMMTMMTMTMMMTTSVQACEVNGRMLAVVGSKTCST